MNAAVDAAVFFLLLGAAVLGVTAADTGESAAAVDGDRPDAVGTVLATSTATVNYSLAPGARRANSEEADGVSSVHFERTAGPEFERTTHGSLAGLLARAAVGTAGFDGAPVTHARDDLRAAVRGAVASRISTVGLRVDAVWRPYPGAPVGGRVAIGRVPPDGEAVDAATLTVPTGAEPFSPRETRDFASLSGAVADRTVDVLAPAGPMRLALRDDAPVSTLARYRYARLAAELNVSVTDAVADADTRTANRRLSSAFASRVESDLRARYDSPEAAAAAVSASEVRVVVRAWDAGRRGNDADATDDERTPEGGR